MKRDSVKRPVLLGQSLSVDPRDVMDPKIDTSGRFVRVYSIAHEGRIAPLVGGIKKLLHFTDRALRSVLAGISNGLPAFFLHRPWAADPLDHDGRSPLARVVGKRLTEHAGKMHALIALAFDKKEDAERYSKISLESPAFHHGADAVVRHVEPPTGLALLPENAMQGFPLAGAASEPVLCGYEEEQALEARVKELEDLINTKIRGDNKMSDMVTLSQVRQYIDNGGPVPLDVLQRVISNQQIKPSALFDSNAVFGTVEVKDGRLIFTDGDPRLYGVLQKKLETHTLIDGETARKQKEAADTFEKNREEFGKWRLGAFHTEIGKKVPDILKARAINDPKLEKFLTDSATLGTLLPSSADDPTKTDAAAGDYVTRAQQLYQSMNPPKTSGAGNAGASNPSSGSGQDQSTDDFFKSLEPK